MVRLESFQQVAKRKRRIITFSRPACASFHFLQTGRVFLVLEMICLLTVNGEEGRGDGQEYEKEIASHLPISAAPPSGGETRHGGKG